MPDGGARYLDGLVPRLVALPNSGLTPIERTEAGQILAQFGDPRPGVGLKDGVPDIDWIEIQAGPFLMGGEGHWHGGGQFECDLIKQP